MSLLLQVSSEATAAEMRALLRADAGGLIFGGLLLALGLVALVLFALRREAKDLALLAFGGFSALYGVRLLASQPTLGLATGLSEETQRAIAAYITYVIPIPAFSFWERMLGRGWKSTLRLGVWLTIVFAVVAVLVESLLGARVALMTVNNILVILGMFIAMINLFFRPPPAVPGLGALRLGGVVLGIFALGENLAGLGIPVWPLGLEMIGFFIFVCCLGYAAALRVAANERKLLAIETALETARSIQRSILPAVVPRVAGLEIVVHYRPATSLAGDFYDFHVVDGKRVGILVADVSGHGIAAALIASMVKVAFTSQAPNAANPGELVRGMSRIFAEQSPESFVTAGYAFLDMEKHAMLYAAAGHPPPLLWRARVGQVHAFREGGTVMGPFADSHYRNTESRLDLGDRLVLYTDGIVEAENAAAEFFGEERLCKFIADNSRLEAGNFADALLEEVAAWSGTSREEAPRDDVTLVVADFRGNSAAGG